MFVPDHCIIGPGITMMLLGKCFTICLFISPDLDGHRMMMNFMYKYTKTIKEADTHKLERPPERVDEGTSKEYEL